jgi:hypothetical protein
VYPVATLGNCPHHPERVKGASQTQTTLRIVLESPLERGSHLVSVHCELDEASIGTCRCALLLCELRPSQVVVEMQSAQVRFFVTEPQLFKAISP